MNSTMIKIINICKEVLNQSNHEVDILKAKIIISKIQYNPTLGTLSKFDLDFITSKQIEYGI